MDFKVTKQPKSKIKFQITGTGEEVHKYFDRATEKLAADLKLSGFRPGKVPADIAKDAIGEGAIKNEAQDLIINDSYFEMVTSQNITPLSRPENIKINELSEEKGLDWEGEVDILPEVELGDWKKELKIKQEKLKVKDIEIEDKEIEEVIEGLKKQFADLEKKDGVSEKGDWISIDIDVAEKEKFTPEQLKKFQAKSFALVIGEANFIPGFEEELVGLKPETEKEFDSTFPANYFEKSLADKKVKFQIKLNEIRKIILPEVNDKFAENFGFEKVEQLKEAIAGDILNRKRDAERMRVEDEALQAVIGVSKIEIPDTLIEQEKDMIMQRFVHDLEHHKGIKFVDYIASLGKSEKEFRDGFTDNAINNVKMGLVMGQIKKDEKVDISEKDIEEAMSMDIVSQTAGAPHDKAVEIEEKIKERYKDEEFLASVKNAVLARKTMEYIMEQVNKK
ncbi:MAG TPA: trigger factor [Patescibacteria group bacterium]|nr:trigger factor [Patescibacteria group bacterium]